MTCNFFPPDRYLTYGIGLTIFDLQYFIYGICACDLSWSERNRPE